LTNPEEPNTDFHLGYQDPVGHRGLYLQMTWAANTLNNGYYGWRMGTLTEFEHKDGSIERPDPWQNAATVGTQYYLSRTMPKSEYVRAISPDGLADTYRQLFGDPWAGEAELIPGLLEQPELLLPFPRGSVWTYTGGPHTGWGVGEPLAAIDFAPPSTQSGCFTPTEDEFSTAAAAGIVARVDNGIVILDLDMDANERTGWSLLYLHLASDGRPPLGTILNAGDPIGYPSCEGGKTTGTHIHIARKYNGEWIIADSPIAFNLEGWVPHNGKDAYAGTLSRDGYIITASAVSDAFSSVPAGQ
jgi:LasA protease